jgi:CheY-like chemotaxis protein
MITFEANRTILRQALLSLLSFLITHAGEHSNLSIDCDSVSDHLEIRIRLAGTTASLPLLEGQDSLFAMIRSLGAALAGPEQGMFVLSMPFEQPTVLVIDDNPDVIDLFRRYLVNQPYRVLAAHNGDQAIRSALAALPDVIILDLMLPKQDGYELLQKLKNHPRTQHIPILICSVLESVDLALALGADGYLKKPPGQSDLLRFLKQWLD